MSSKLRYILLALSIFIAACGGGGGGGGGGSGSGGNGGDGGEPPAPVEGLPFLAFVGTNGADGFELWKTSGDVDGTQMIKNINTTAGQSSDPIIHQSMPQTNNQTIYHNKLVFKANDGTGEQLWITDGTDTGTYPLTSGNNTFDSAFSFEMAIYKDLIYFSLFNNTLGKTELWKSNGTAEGTVLVRPFNEFTHQTNFVVFQDKLFFAADDGGGKGEEMWVITDVSDTGGLFKDLHPDLSAGSSPSNFTVLNNKLFFTAIYKYPDSSINYLLWVSDGTAANTKPLVTDKFDAFTIDPSLTVFNNKLYFVANPLDMSGSRRIYQTDGTAEGTVEFNATTPQDNIAHLQVFKDKLIYINDLDEMYTVDTSGNIATLTKDIAGMDVSAGMVEFDGKLFFQASDGANYELWTTDGTAANTGMFKNIRTEPTKTEIGPSSEPRYFRVFNGKLYFTALGDVGGRELWVSDGTPGGTNMFINLDGQDTDGVAYTY